jgi:hypothetical protein
MYQGVGDANSRRLMAAFESVIRGGQVERLYCEYFGFSMSVVAQLMKSFRIFLLIRYYWGAIISRKLRWAGHMARIREKGN